SDAVRSACLSLWSGTSCHARKRCRGCARRSKSYEYAGYAHVSNGCRLPSPLSALSCILEALRSIDHNLDWNRRCAMSDAAFEATTSGGALLRPADARVRALRAAAEEAIMVVCDA